MDELERQFSKLLIFFISYTLIFLLFKETLAYTLPFVLAGIFALILKKPTELLIKKTNLKPWLSSLITTILFFTFIIILTVILIISLTSEIASITSNLQEHISSNSSNYFVKITEFFQNILNNIDIDKNIWDSIKSSTTESINKFINISINIGSSVVSGTIKAVSYIPYIGMVIIFTLLSTYFFTKNICTSNSVNLINKIPFGDKKLPYAFSQSKKMLGNYFLSYLLIIFITFLITLLGFIIFQIKYSLLLSILCAILDILPLIGIIIIYFPLALYYIIQGNYMLGVGIIILYLLVSIVRQIVEPKIMSTTLGLNPISVLAAMFIGLKASGFIGMIFCMFLIVSYTILKKVEIL